MTQAFELFSFLVWSRSSSAIGWLFGMAVRIALFGVIALVLLNPTNPAYNPQARGHLDTQAQTIETTGELAQAELWWQLLHSASVECYYRATSPQQFLLAGTLPDEYITPNSNAPRWYVKFPLNMSMQMFGPSLYEAGVVTMQQFYYMVQSQGFKPCSAREATKARNLLGL